MSRISIISYPNRARDCNVYLKSSTYEGSSIILCPYRSIFSRVDLDSEHIISTYRNRLSLFRSRRYFAESLKSDLKYFLRSGSSFGVGIERILKYLSLRIASISQMNEQEGASVSEIKNQPVYNRRLFLFLEAFHQEDPIEEIIVFDICDLPTVLEFSEPKGIRTLIR